MVTIENIKSEAQKAIECDTPAERAKGYRSVLSLAVDYIFESSHEKKPEKASLLELVDSDVVSNYVKDSDIVNSLHYVRILGINAEHGQKIKKSEDKLAQDNLQECKFVPKCNLLINTVIMTFGCAYHRSW